MALSCSYNQRFKRECCGFLLLLFVLFSFNSCWHRLGVFTLPLGARPRSHHLLPRVARPFGQVPPPPSLGVSFEHDSRPRHSGSVEVLLLRRAAMCCRSCPGACRLTARSRRGQLTPRQRLRWCRGLFLPHALASHTAAALCSDSRFPLSECDFCWRFNRFHVFKDTLPLLLTALLALFCLGPQMP